MVSTVYDEFEVLGPGLVHESFRKQELDRNYVPMDVDGRARKSKSRW